MGNNSLNEITSLINQQIESQEKLVGCLFKLEALVRVMNPIDGVQHVPSSVLYGCFSLAEDLIETAIQLNQSCLDRLLKP